MEIVRLGRVALALGPGGEAIVGWLAVAGQEGEIRVRRVAPDGRAGKALTIAAASQARASGFPRLAVAGGELARHLGGGGRAVADPGREPAARRAARRTLT